MVQDPGVLVRPMDQILHSVRSRVAVEFPLLHPPVKTLYCDSENEKINEISTAFSPSEKLLPSNETWGQGTLWKWNSKPTGELTCPRFSISTPTNLEELLSRSAMFGELTGFVRYKQFYWSLHRVMSVDQSYPSVNHNLASDWLLHMFRASITIMPRAIPELWICRNTYLLGESYTCSARLILWRTNKQIKQASNVFQLNLFSQSLLSDNKPRKGSKIIYTTYIRTRTLVDSPEVNVWSRSVVGYLIFLYFPFQTGTRFAL